MRWLITGGCGYIGTGLIRKLLSVGENDILLLDNLSTGTTSDLQLVSDYKEIDPSNGATTDGVVLVVGDIKDEALTVLCAKNRDVVVHLAANTGVAPSVDDPRSDCYANVIGTLNMLEAARENGVKRFVFASSGAPAGEVDPPIHEELPPHPVSPYGASKLAGEGYCSAYYRTFGLETVCLRFSNVYGPGSIHKGSVVAKFFSLSTRGESWCVYGDGEQTRDFIYIDDLIEAVYLASNTKDIGGETFQIATNSETSINELIGLMRDVLSKRGVDTAEVLYEPARLGDVKRNYSDISKARKVLGWEPKIELKNGLLSTIEYYLKLTK